MTRSLGPDADDPDLTLEAWRERIRRHPGELKPLLRNQLFVAGIGNAYSDEILHAARLNPFRKRTTLAAEEIDELYRADADDPRQRDRGPAHEGASHLRDAGAGLPGRASKGRHRLPALWDSDQRGVVPGRGDLVVPGLPGLTPARASAGHGIRRTRPTRMTFDVSPFSSLIAATVVPKVLAIP